MVSISSLDDEQNPNFTVAGTVEILSAVTTDTEEEGLTGNEKLDLETYPNPFSGFLTMEINGQRGPVHIEVVDLLGRRVRTVYSGRLDSRTVFKWNGRDEAGRMLPNGMYFVRFESSSQIGIKPVTLLK